MAGKAVRRIPVWVRAPIVVTVVLAGVFASSAVWGLTGSGGGHGGGSQGGSEHGSSSSEQTDGGTHARDSDSDGPDHGSDGDAGRGDHGLGPSGAPTGTASTTL